MSKIIDANKVQRKLLEECQNIRYFDKDRKKKQIFADGLDFAWVMLDNAPTVDAIPIEWIRSQKVDYQNEYLPFDYCRGMQDGYNACIDYLIDKWEDENEKNI